MADPAASPSPEMEYALRVEEFRALRATIRERGTLRLALAGLGLAGWAVLLLVIRIWLPDPMTLLVPLLVLSTLFEAVFTLHVGVERIGRYLEASFESDSAAGPRWEQTAHAFGQTQASGAGRLDPLFSAAFVSAALLNLVAVLLLVAGPGLWDAGPATESAVYGGLHAAFIVRVVRARRFASGQRAQELERFKQLSGAD
jgi:hypothetical protein